MPAIQKAVSARVLGPEQAAATTNGAGSVYEGKYHRGHAPPPPAGAVGAGHARETHARETTNNPP